MTREEAVKWLNRELKVWEKDCLSKHPIKEALSVAIEALEQETFINKPCCISGEVCEHDKNVVLDKISAEIEELKEGRYFSNYDMHIYKTCLKDAIDIIDKYKAESDEKDEEGE